MSFDSESSLRNIWAVIFRSLLKLKQPFTRGEHRYSESSSVPILEGSHFKKYGATLAVRGTTLAVRGFFSTLMKLSTELDSAVLN